MTDNTSTSNPTLTFDQLQAIDVAQKRLAVLESEIVNAQKVLKGTKMEADRATKENIYQNDLLVEVSSKVETKQKELEDLKTNFLEISYNLDDLNKEIKEKTKVQADKELELNNRENDISSKETTLQLKENKLASEQNTLEENLLSFNSKVVKLKEVMSKF